jgi:hypothetical protein
MDVLNESDSRVALVTGANRGSGWRPCAGWRSAATPRCGMPGIWPKASVPRPSWRAPAWGAAVRAGRRRPGDHPPPGGRGAGHVRAAGRADEQCGHPVRHVAIGPGGEPRGGPRGDGDQCLRRVAYSAAMQSFGPSMKDVQRPCSSKRITKQLSNSRNNAPLASKYSDRPVATARSPSIASGAYWPWYVLGASRLSSHALTIASRPRATWSPASQGCQAIGGVFGEELADCVRVICLPARTYARASGSRCLGPVALVILPGAPSAYAACAWLHVRSAERALRPRAPPSAATSVPRCVPPLANAADQSRRRCARSRAQA